MPIASNSPTPLDRLNWILSDDPDGDIAFLAREAIVMLPDPDAFDDLTDELAAILTAICDDRESLTTLCLDFSLCPLHYCDYAICFDDETDECAAIRTIHPNHDT